MESNLQGFQEKLTEEISLKVVIVKKITAVKLYPSGKQEITYTCMESVPTLIRIGEKISTDQKNVHKFIPDKNLVRTLNLSNGLSLCVSLPERHDPDSLSIYAKVLMDLGVPKDSSPKSQAGFTASGLKNRYTGSNRKGTSNTVHATSSSNYPVGLRSDGGQQTSYPSSGFLFDDEASNESSNFDSFVSTGHLDYNHGPALGSPRQGGVHQNMFVSSEVLVKTGKNRSPRTKTSAAVTCRVCGKSFFTEKQLFHHMRMHEGQRRDGKYHCRICNRTYNKRHYYLGHKRTAKCDRASMWSCSKCDKLFTTQPVLKKHTRLYHGEGETYKCKCKKVFASLKSFTRHRAKGCVDYTQPKPIVKTIYKCDTCGKILSTKGSLERHFQIHTEDKLFVCTTCNKGFGDRTVLKNHILYKHKDYRPFLCPQCGRGFHKAKDLRNHIEVHAKYPLQCSICYRFYQHKNKLERHMTKAHKTPKKDQGAPKMQKLPTSSPL